jgi:hypothetical protein
MAKTIPTEVVNDPLETTRRVSCTFTIKGDKIQNMFDRKTYMLAYNKAYYQGNKEREKQRNKDFAKLNPEKVREMRKNWDIANRAEYRKRNIDKIRANARKYRNKKSTWEKECLRKKFDINFRLKHLLCRQVGNALKKQSAKKCSKTVNLLGCSIQEAREHIEKQFKEGMSWDNYGLHTWHIDHIYPLSRFDLTKTEEQKKAFHYTNLQPLFARLTASCRIA